MGRIPLLEARLASKDQVEVKADTEIVAVFQDSSKKPILPKGIYGTWVQKLRKVDAFEANLGQIQFIRFAEKGGAENVLFLGLGILAEITEEKLRSAGGHAWGKLKGEKVKTASIRVEHLFDSRKTDSASSHARSVRAFAEGLVLNAYQFTKHKTKPGLGEEGGVSKITFLTPEKALKAHLDPELVHVEQAAEAMGVTRDWSNEPSNYGTPQFYANEAKKLAQKQGLKCHILTEKDAAREKMGLFLGVGQGSERESRIVVVEYSPKNTQKTAAKDVKTIALVGKGVTFDSGGISIKPALRMEEMKHDMTGAATVMGAILLAASWKVPHRVIAIMAFTENMPNGDAIQPGNVLTSRNGKTVEIINTDAEGRLILADALDYAQDFKPDAIVDVATLTGAVSIALGKHCCAVLGTDEDLIESLRNAGMANGERIWQLPLYDEYFEDLKSECADMKNSANDSYGGTIRGAMFLKQFIKKSVSWAHLDIAATAYNVSHLSYYPKRGANGAYVRSLAQFISDF